MTLLEMETEIWSLGGEPGDLYDEDTDEFSSILAQAVNNGVKNVATWRDPHSGRGVKYPNLFGETIFSTYFEEGELEDDGTTTTVVLPATASAVNDAYNGWVIEVEGNARYIVDYVGSTRTATVLSAFPSVPEVGDAYSLGKNFTRFLSSAHSLNTYHTSVPEGMLLPVRVSNLTSGITLIRESRVEDFVNAITTFGTPTGYAYREDRLIFNVIPDDEYYIKVEYTRLPQVLEEDTDIPEIPEMYHYGVVLWGRWWIYAREQGHPEAYAAKKDFEDYMRQRIGVYHFEDELETRFGTIRSR